MSSYLVNCLLPRDPSIYILAQHRSYDQSVYQLTFNTSWGRWSTSLPVIKTYVYQGIGHILSGYDHLLFIGGLVLGAKRLWDIVKIVTAFTVAHSVTLVLAVY